MIGQLSHISYFGMYIGIGNINHSLCRSRKTPSLSPDLGPPGRPSRLYILRYLQRHYIASVIVAHKFKASAPKNLNPPFRPQYLLLLLLRFLPFTSFLSFVPMASYRSSKSHGKTTRCPTSSSCTSSPYQPTPQAIESPPSALHIVLVTGLQLLASLGKNLPLLLEFLLFKARDQG